MHRMLLVRPFITRSNVNPDGDDRSTTTPYGYVSKTALGASLLAVAIVAGIVGAVLGRLHVKEDCNDDIQQSDDVSSKSAKDASTYADPESILNYLRTVTAVPHLAGTPQDLQQARDLKTLWLEQGLDEVSILPYDVLLSYPDKNNPNKIFIVNSQGKEVFQTSGIQTALHSPEENSPLLYPNFNAYSSPGIIQGNLVYVNYGRKEDFEYLISKKVSIRGNVVLARYGKIFRGNIVKFAEKYGATGVILFSDPVDFAIQGEDRVYPDSIQMPGMAVQSGTTYVHNGDPLTPLIPSIDGMYRRDESEADLPSIPVQPIGYQEAERILRYVEGERAPSSWTGALNTTYRVGPDMKGDYKVKMDIKTKNQRKTTYNVIGMLKGKVEPDRYVILGNHRDAWTFGSIDPSSGSASLMEIVKVFTKLKADKDWRPYRSMLFCSWGAEEYGLIGSMEWVEEHMNVLVNRAVVYLNMDMAIEGNASLKAEAVPLLYNAIYESAKKISNPSPGERDEGRGTVYDTWNHIFPRSDANKPVIKGIGSGSDYTGFIHYLGIPSVDVRYTYTEDLSSFPLYHTLYETFYLVNRVYDEGGHYMTAVTKVWLELAMKMADEEVLPFGMADYGEYLTSEVEKFKGKYGKIMDERGASLDWLSWAASNFSSAIKNFEHRVKYTNRRDALKVRQVNDQMMQLERCFINPQGLPGRPDIRHVLFAPSTQDTYSSTSFAGLVDLLHAVKTSVDPKPIWKDLKRHLSEIVYHIRSATQILDPGLPTRDLS